jgi:hypothetical protein
MLWVQFAFAAFFINLLVAHSFTTAFTRPYALTILLVGAAYLLHAVANVICDGMSEISTIDQTIIVLKISLLYSTHHDL